MQVTQRKFKETERGKGLIWGFGFRVDILPWPVLRRVRSSMRGHLSLFQVERDYILEEKEHNKRKLWSLHGGQEEQQGCRVTPFLLVRSAGASGMTLIFLVFPQLAAASAGAATWPPAAPRAGMQPRSCSLGSASMRAVLSSITWIFPTRLAEVKNTFLVSREKKRGGKKNRNKYKCLG